MTDRGKMLSPSVLVEGDRRFQRALVELFAAYRARNPDSTGTLNTKFFSKILSQSSICLFPYSQQCVLEKEYPSGSVCYPNEAHAIIKYNVPFPQSSHTYAMIAPSYGTAKRMLLVSKAEGELVPSGSNIVVFLNLEKPRVESAPIDLLCLLQSSIQRLATTSFEEVKDAMSKAIEHAIEFGLLLEPLKNESDHFKRRPFDKNECMLLYQDAISELVKSNFDGYLDFIRVAPINANLPVILILAEIEEGIASKKAIHEACKVLRQLETVNLSMCLDEKKRQAAIENVVKDDLATLYSKDSP